MADLMITSCLIIECAHCLEGNIAG